MAIVDYKALFASNFFTRSQVDALVRVMKLLSADTYSVASQAAMLALPAKKGDLCVRTDQAKTYSLSAEPATVLANWIWLQ